MCVCVKKKQGLKVEVEYSSHMRDDGQRQKSQSMAGSKIGPATQDALGPQSSQLPEVRGHFTEAGI